MEHYEQLDGPQFHGPLTSAVSASPEQGNRPGGPATQKTLIKTFIKRFKWYYLFAACIIIALLVVVIVISVYYSKKNNTEENVSCLPTTTPVKEDDRQDPDFSASIEMFWPWSDDMKNTNSPMYEETISKAEYWVTKIFQTSSLSSCIRNAATEIKDQGRNISVQFKLYVSCDSGGEMEVNKAYIEGHSLLQRTQYKSCVAVISKNIYLQKWSNTLTTKKSDTEENMSCLPSLPLVELNSDEDPDFVALIVFFWPWSPDMEDTNSPMYEETISKAEYWVTKIFQASFLSSCITSPARAMMDLGGNTLVRFDLYVSCDTATEVEINRAYIDGHSFLQRTQDKSCVVNIGENLILRRFFPTTITPLPPSETPNFNGSCPPSPPRDKMDYSRDADFLALIVFFWPWSPDMEDTNSPMYEETISKAEYWVTKIFQTSSLSSCIRSAAQTMRDQGGNILVHFKLYVSCDNAAEAEINRAYIEGHLLLQRTQDKSCVVSIGKDIHLRQLSNTISSKDPDYPFAINDTICGQSQLYPVPKIVGGRPAKRGQYPWVVKVQTSIIECGGTIWDYSHILTAAHCINMLPINDRTGRVDPRGIVVIAGEWEHTSVYSYLQQKRSVASARMHRHYYSNVTDIANDIALLKLAKPLHPTQLVMKVCHPDASTQLPKKGIVAGWGQTKEEPARDPVVLQSLEVTVLNQSDCQKLRRLYGFANLVHKGTICSIDDDLEVKGVCMGDSGGPLFANLGTRGDERYTIFGIVSHINKCGGYSNAYASVPYYRDWIHRTIQFLKHL